MTYPNSLTSLSDIIGDLAASWLCKQSDVENDEKILSSLVVNAIGLLRDGWKSQMDAKKITKVVEARLLRLASKECDKEDALKIRCMVCHALTLTSWLVSKITSWGAYAIGYALELEIVAEAMAADLDIKPCQDLGHTAYELAASQLVNQCLATGGLTEIEDVGGNSKIVELKVEAPASSLIELFRQYIQQAFSDGDAERLSELDNILVRMDADYGNAEIHALRQELEEKRRELNNKEKPMHIDQQIIQNTGEVTHG